MRFSNNRSDTLYVESTHGKDMIVVATGGFKLFLTCLQPSKRKNESNQPEAVFVKWNAHKKPQPTEKSR